MKNFIKQYWVSLLLGLIGLGITLDTASLIITLQAIGLISIILFFVSIILDDKKGQGLFPSYCEGDLLKVAEKDPMASAMIVVVKNILIIVVIILAYFFIKP